MIAKIKDKPYYLWLLSISSGLLLYLAWQVHPFLLFIAFIPLLEIDICLNPQQVKKSGFKFFLHTFVALLIWNILSFNWLFQINYTGAILFLFIQVFFMCLPFLLFRSTKQAINEAYGYFAWVLYWLSFEYIQINWEITWPWLNLGNAFASTPYFIQWYSNTGVLGGTLWALAMNIFIYLTFKSKFLVNRKVFGIYTILTFLIAFLYSYYIYLQGTILKATKIEAFVIQTEEQDITTLLEEQLNRNSSTWFFIPEYEPFPKFYIDNFPQANIIFSIYKRPSPVDLFTRLNFVLSLRKDLYETSPSYAIPWVEDSPTWDGLPRAFNRQYSSEPPSLAMDKDSHAIAPITSHEALYSHIVRPYIQTSKQALAVFSDYSHLPAFENQIRQYLRLRAIEFRRNIAWVPFKGEASFIDHRGKFIKSKNANTAYLVPYRQKTFYYQHGDYLGRLAWFLAVGLFLTGLVKNKVNPNPRSK